MKTDCGAIRQFFFRGMATWNRPCFSRSFLSYLVWDGFSLNPLWKLENMNGTIRDYGIADVDNDNVAELFVCLNTRAGLLGINRVQSFFLFYEIEPLHHRSCSYNWWYGINPFIGSSKKFFFTALRKLHFNTWRRCDKTVFQSEILVFGKFLNWKKLIFSHCRPFPSFWTDNFQKNNS